MPSCNELLDVLCADTGVNIDGLAHDYGTVLVLIKLTKIFSSVAVAVIIFFCLYFIIFCDI